MKIGIDARMLGEEQTGIGLYIQNLIENIEILDTENEYILFLRKGKFSSFELESNNFKKVLSDSKWYSFSEQFSFLCQIKKEKVDLMHFPSFNAPIFYSGNRITTIHDLTPKYFPGHKMNSLLRRIAFWFVFRASIKKSKKIIAVSEYTKKEILKYYKLNEEKIRVIYQGIPNGNEGSTELKGEELILMEDRFLKKYKLNDPYIFYTGVWRSHKNLVGLIKAFGILKKKHKKDIKLVLGGKEDKFYPEIRQTWEDLDLGSEIIRPGFIDKKEMSLFLSNAELFVLPSFVEGFGFGPLEALSFETPVVVSSAGAMPEVLGESAVYFNPDDPKDMAEKINQVLEDDILKKTLINNGKERLKMYSWVNCAEKTIETYKNCI